MFEMDVSNSHSTYCREDIKEALLSEHGRCRTECTEDGLEGDPVNVRQMLPLGHGSGEGGAE